MIEHVIHHEMKLVFSYGTGVLTLDHFVSDQENLKNEPDFNPEYCHLFDFTDVQEVKMNSDDFRKFAKIRLFSSESKRAVVVSQNFMYGLARMYEGLGNISSDNFRIFRSLTEACKWLNLSVESIHGLKADRLN